MSHKTSNKAADRQAQWKTVAQRLQAGTPVAKLKPEVTALLRESTPADMVAMEKALIEQGFPQEMIRSLCDLHAQIFDEALQAADSPGDIEGHPVHSLRQEIKLARHQLMNLSATREGLPSPLQDTEAWIGCRKDLDRLKEIEKHCWRLENLLLPALYTEKMTAVVQDVRARIDSIRTLFSVVDNHLDQKHTEAVKEAMAQLVEALQALMDLEEQTLLPKALQTLSDAAWAEMKKDEPAIGYAWIQPGDLWDANLATVKSIQPFGTIDTHESIT